MQATEIGTRQLEQVAGNWDNPSQFDNIRLPHLERSDNTSAALESSEQSLPEIGEGVGMEVEYEVGFLSLRTPLPRPSSLKYQLQNVKLLI